MALKAIKSIFSPERKGGEYPSDHGPMSDVVNGTDQGKPSKNEHTLCITERDNGNMLMYDWKVNTPDAFNGTITYRLLRIGGTIHSTFVSLGELQALPTPSNMSIPPEDTVLISPAGNGEFSLTAGAATATSSDNWKECKGLRLLRENGEEVCLSWKDLEAARQQKLSANNPDPDAKARVHVIVAEGKRKGTTPS